LTRRVAAQEQHEEEDRGDLEAQSKKGGAARKRFNHKGVRPRKACTLSQLFLMIVVVCMFLSVLGFLFFTRRGAAGAPKMK
jgi:hypothetical protein